MRKEGKVDPAVYITRNYPYATGSRCKQPQKPAWIGSVQKRVFRCAVCGQIAGAYYGYSAIPERWLSVIKDRKKLDALIDGFTDTFLNKPNEPNDR